MLKCKRIMALVVALTCLGAMLAIPAAAVELTLPAEPAGTSAEMLIPTQTFTPYSRFANALIAYPVTSSSENRAYQINDPRYAPYVADLGGERGYALRMSRSDSYAPRAFFLFVPGTTTTSPFPGEPNNAVTLTEGFAVLKAKVMIPNVAPAGELPFGGGSVQLALSSLNDKTPVPRYSFLIRANKGEQKGSIYMEGESIVAGGAFNAEVTVDIRPDQWYEFKIVADIEKGQSDVYLDDVPIAFDVPCAYNSSLATNFSICSLAVVPGTANTTVPAGYSYVKVETVSGTKVSSVVTATETMNFNYCPYPIYIDDIKVYTVSDADAVAHLKYGLDKKIGKLITGEVALPYVGTATRGISIALASTPDSGMTITSFERNNKPKIKVIRPTGSDIEAELFLSVSKGEVYEDEFPLPVTIKRVLPYAVGYDSLEVEAPVITGSAATGETVTANGLLINKGSDDVKAIALIGIYNGNMLVKCNLERINVKSGEIKPVSISITPDASAAGLTARAYIWGSELNPLHQAQ